MTIEQAANIKFADKLIITKSHNGLKIGQKFLFGNWIHEYYCIGDVCAIHYYIDINNIEHYINPQEIKLLRNKILKKYCK